MACETASGLPTSQQKQRGRAQVVGMRASSAVLSLAELLENVLVDLDMRTILLSQRVNETRTSTIERSPDLQDKLFFALKAHSGKDGVNAIKTLLVKRVKRAGADGARGNLAVHKSFECMFAFDLSTLPARASAYKMTLSWYGREMCPGAQTKYQKYVDATDLRMEVSRVLQYCSQLHFYDKLLYQLQHTSTTHHITYKMAPNTKKTPAMEVFDLPKLLAAILHQLDMKTLLFAQRVNKKLMTAIETSEECQDKLFFRLKEAGARAASTCSIPCSSKPPLPPARFMEWTFKFDISMLPQHASAHRMALSWILREHCPAAGTAMQFVKKTKSGKEIMGWRVRDPTVRVGAQGGKDDGSQAYRDYSGAKSGRHFGARGGGYYSDYYESDDGDDYDDSGDDDDW
ncbi:hypothetical protein LTR95_012168 [Oleoguttula sp. CCFEE 5521]